jgi:hypothetical protein
MTSSSSGSSEGRQVTCPVCREQTDTDCFESMGVVLSAAKALVRGDKELIVAAMEGSVEYDFHVAVTMYVDVLAVLAEYACVDFEDLLADQRRQLDHALRTRGA